MEHTKARLSSEMLDIKQVNDASAFEVLPNNRLGLRLPPLKCGKVVYLSVDGHTRLCEHGETASMISQWCSNGPCERPAHSVCSCKNVDGLTVGRFQTAPAGWNPPRYYDVLVANGARECELGGGRVARHIPTTEGVNEMWMLPSGSIRCRHGNSLNTLKAMASSQLSRKFRNRCDCKVGNQSWRSGRMQTLKVKRKF